MAKVVSVGILIKLQNRILLVKPSNSGKRKLWGFPKGKIEEGETLEQCASRETFEEIGILIEPNKLKGEPKKIEYRDKKNRLYKTVYYYLYEINDLSEIGLDTDEVPKENLALREVNKAKFMDYDKAKDKIFWRMKECLDYIRNNENISIT